MSKRLYQLTNSAPSTCGGGTVNYVNGFDEQLTLYVEDIEEREMGGTPPIIQTIRAALAFRVKEYRGYDAIEKRESFYIQAALERLLQSPQHKDSGEHKCQEIGPSCRFWLYNGRVEQMERKATRRRSCFMDSRGHAPQ